MIETATVLVTRYHQTRGVDLSVNGRRVRIPIGRPTRIPAVMLDALRDSSAVFEIVPEPQPAPGPVPEPPAPAPAAVVDVAGILGGNADQVEAAIPSLTAAQLEELLAAERAAKNRKTVIADIERAIAASGGG